MIAQSTVMLFRLAGQQQGTCPALPCLSVRVLVLHQPGFLGYGCYEIVMVAKSIAPEVTSESAQL